MKKKLSSIIILVGLSAFSANASAFSLWDWLFDKPTPKVTVKSTCPEYGCTGSPG